MPDPVLSHIPPPDDLTLRRRVETAIKLSRDLDDHLRQSVAPAANRLRRLVKDGAAADDGTPHRDRTVRHGADAVLEADRFARALRGRLTQYCDSIAADVAAEVRAASPV